MASDNDARSQMLEFLLREMDFYLDSLNSLRTALSTLMGLGVTVVLALAGLAYRDGRQPPAAFVVIGSLLLLAAVVWGLATIPRMRRAVEWPEGDTLLEDQSGSVVDLRERYISEFRDKVGDVRKRTQRFDLSYLFVLVAVMLSAVMWVIALARTAPPAAPETDPAARQNQATTSMLPTTMPPPPSPKTSRETPATTAETPMPTSRR